MVLLAFFQQPARNKSLAAIGAGQQLHLPAAKRFKVSSVLTMRLTDKRDILVSRSISRELLLLHGLSSWLQIRCSTIAMFAVVLADRGRPLPF